MKEKKFKRVGWYVEERYYQKESWQPIYETFGGLHKEAIEKIPYNGVQTKIEYFNFHAKSGRLRVVPLYVESTP